jgi:plasmid stability protein
MLEMPMASLTIRNIDDALKEKLRVCAARHGHSMEEEARIILRRAVGGMTGPALWSLSRDLFGGDKGVELDPPDRGQDRAAPDFDDSAQSR